MFSCGLVYTYSKHHGEMLLMSNESIYCYIHIFGGQFILVLLAVNVVNEKITKIK